MTRDPLLQSPTGVIPLPRRERKLAQELSARRPQLPQQWPCRPASAGVGVLLLALAVPPDAAAQSAASGAPPPTQAVRTSAGDTVFHLEPLAEGVWAAVVHPTPPMYVFANALVVRGSDGLLVVDTHASAAAARSLISELRRLTRLPVRYIVNTHWHGDHVYGNAAYLDAYPGAEIVGHEAMAEDLATLGAERLAQERAELPPSVDDRRRWLESGTGPDGQPLTERQRAAVRRSLELRSAQADELENLRLFGPTRTVERRLALDVGGRAVEVLHFGPAHTRGDLVVWLPDEGILAAGDLLEDAFPWTGDSYPGGWAAVLDSIAGLEPTVILPSHGPVLRDRELLETERRLMHAAVAAARTALATGEVLEGLLESAELDAFRDAFTAPGGAGEAAFREGVRTVLERAWKEARGELP